MYLHRRIFSRMRSSRNWTRHYLCNWSGASHCTCSQQPRRYGVEFLDMCWSRNTRRSAVVDGEKRTACLPSEWIDIKLVAEYGRNSIYCTNKWSFSQRKTMRASSPSSSTSSVYTSADDARRCTGYERSQFLNLEDVGTAWLLGSHFSHDRSKRILERFKVDKWVTLYVRYHENTKLVFLQHNFVACVASRVSSNITFQFT